MKKNGRKSKLTPERGAQLVDDVRHNVYIETACRRVRITEKTYYNWVDRADRGEEPYASFLQSIRAAESEGEANLVRILVKHEQVDATLTTKLDEEIERRLLKGREANAKGLLKGREANAKGLKA